MAWLRAKATRVPDRVDLIYAYNHIVFRNRPWVIFVEWAHTPIGRDVRQFARFRKLIERHFGGQNCKHIITWCTAARDSISENLDTSRFSDKISVVPLAVHPKKRVERQWDGKLKMLYLGSTNVTSADDFLQKGGIDVIEAMKILGRISQNIELVIRSNLPEGIGKTCRSLKNIRIIEGVVSQDRLEEEFSTANVFVQPNRLTPFGAYLEAMSYGLPVITRDAHANREIVEDGVTGYVMKDDFDGDYFRNDYGVRMIPLAEWPVSLKYMNAISRVDRPFAMKIAEKALSLADNPHLLARLSERARYEVEYGKFSVRRRNERLKSIFDQILQ